MLDQDEGHAGARRQRADQPGAGVQPARRCADGDDGEIWPAAARAALSSAWSACLACGPVPRAEVPARTITPPDFTLVPRGACADGSSSGALPAQVNRPDGRNHLPMWELPSLTSTCRSVRSRSPGTGVPPCKKPTTPCPNKIRVQSVELLNLHLAAAIDLHAQMKQAHWNVRGPGFIAIHELFDRVSIGG